MIHPSVTSPENDLYMNLCAAAIVGALTQIATYCLLPEFAAVSAVGIPIVLGAIASQDIAEYLVKKKIVHLEKWQLSAIPLALATAIAAISLAVLAVSSSSFIAGSSLLFSSALIVRYTAEIVVNDIADVCRNC
jgi:hypothetical protein